MDLRAECRGREEISKLEDGVPAERLGKREEHLWDLQHKKV